ncbi:MAG: ATP-binding protein [Rikenellaceae bacterium]
MIKILLIIAIVTQTIATIFAIRLVRETKYNAIWILFIAGFTVLSVERYLQLINFNGGEVPMRTFYFTGVVVSIGLSIGVMYAHKLVHYIDRLTEHRTLVSKRILSAVLRAEERSRSRFSKDIHDGLGPLLSSAKMSLSALDHARSEEDRAQIIHDTTYLIDEAVRSIREISNNLSPQLLSDFGLNRAISTFIKKSGTSHLMKISFTSNLESRRYGMEAEVILYRVICELINNSIKHSECSAIDLSLNHIDGCMQLDYRDNGVGFDPEAMLDCGMGLSNISSRVNMLNGEFQITSSSGKGMRAEVRIDIGEAQK